LLPLLSLSLLLLLLLLSLLSLLLLSAILGAGVTITQPVADAL
jgi:hypothetical protein